MHHADQRVIILTESQQRDSDERPGREVESQRASFSARRRASLSRAASGWSEMSVTGASKAPGHG